MHLRACDIAMYMALLSSTCYSLLVYTILSDKFDEKIIMSIDTDLLSKFRPLLFNYYCLHLSNRGQTGSLNLANTILCLLKYFNCNIKQSF